MSTSVFPSTSQLPGIDIVVTRKVEWDTIVQEAVSGKETRIARRIYPRREYTLKFNFLRTGVTYLELQTLEGFFNERQGMFDSFQYFDMDDNAITAQTIGVGDSTNVAFQLVRPWGGFVEPIYAPISVANVTVGSTVFGSSLYTLSGWGSTSPGVITFSSLAIPPSGQNVVTDMSYNWPVRFSADDESFDRIVNAIFEGKAVTFKTII